MAKSGQSATLTAIDFGRRYRLDYIPDVTIHIDGPSLWGEIEPTDPVLFGKQDLSHIFEKSARPSLHSLAPGDYTMFVEIVTDARQPHFLFHILGENKPPPVRIDLHDLEGASYKAQLEIGHILLAQYEGDLDSAQNDPRYNQAGKAAVLGVLRDALAPWFGENEPFYDNVYGWLNFAFGHELMIVENLLHRDYIEDTEVVIEYEGRMQEPGQAFPDQPRHEFN